MKVRPSAEWELQEVADWYDEQRAGLGSEFFRCIDEAFDKIV